MSLPTTNWLVPDRIHSNGGKCDRCGDEVSPYATHIAEHWEYVCVGCMTPEEREAFGVAG